MIYIWQSIFTLAAQGLIVSGVFFISAQFLPQVLASLYASTGMVTRTVMTAVTIFPLANFMMAYAFRHFGPSFAAPAMLASAVLVNIAFSALALQSKLSAQLFLATVVVMAGCVWVSLLLQQKAG